MKRKFTQPILRPVAKPNLTRKNAPLGACLAGVENKAVIWRRF